MSIIYDNRSRIGTRVKQLKSGKLAVANNDAAVPTAAGTAVPVPRAKKAAKEGGDAAAPVDKKNDDKW